MKSSCIHHTFVHAWKVFISSHIGKISILPSVFIYVSPLLLTQDMSLLIFLVTRYVDVSPPTPGSSLRHQPGILQFSSVSTWRWRQIPQVKGLVPRDCCAPNTFLPCHAVYMPSDKPRLSEVLKSPSLNLINLLEWFAELRETLITLTSLLRVMVKDSDDEQPEEDIHRVRTGRVPSTGASVPVDLGHLTLHVWMCSSTWKLSEALQSPWYVYGGLTT